MPRRPRTVISHLPHHITQRANRRERVFHAREDYLTYLGWLRKYSRKYDVEILAYCLMSNHVHLIAVPASEKSLQKTMKPLHMRYAQWCNHKQGSNGLVWQGRFFSSILDEVYFWAALRYVEQNPVRANIVKRPEDYPWSSAAAHCDKLDDPVLTDNPSWKTLLEQVSDWSLWLEEHEDDEKLKVLRQQADKGLPCGSTAFISELERVTGCSLLPRTRGRPRKKQSPGLNTRKKGIKKG